MKFFTNGDVFDDATVVVWVTATGVALAVVVAAEFAFLIITCAVGL